MRNAYELLEQKERDLGRVRKEVESIRIVASLLSDESASSDDGDEPNRDEHDEPEEEQASMELVPEPPAMFLEMESQPKTAMQRVVGIFRKRPA